MRKRLFEIIESASDNDKASLIYDYVMMVAIFVSIVPLAFKAENEIFDIIDKVTVAIFIIDYILRFITADYKLKDKKYPFIKYPFTLMAIIDLLSILPSLTLLNSSFRLLKLVRLLRTLKILRLVKAARYSTNLQKVINVFKREKDALTVVCAIAVAYVLISALVILNVEPDSFENYYEAIYWATVSLTTMGYGDIYPVSAVGRLMTMVSSFVGIAIVAIPAGIITSGFIAELGQNKDDDKRKSDCE